MEKKEDELPKGRVFIYVNTYEIFQEVRRLKQIKEKNEKMIPEVDLQGKYKQSYERLCEELKQRQCELRVNYAKAIRLLSAVMVGSVYMESESEDIWIDQEMNRLLKESGGDPLLKELFLAFWRFGDDQIQKDGKEEEKHGTRK